MADAPTRVLGVEDDPCFNDTLCRSLNRRGYGARGAREDGQALAVAEDYRPTHVVLDLNLAGQSALPLIPALRHRVPDTRVLVLTGFASLATAVDAIKLGACNYLIKPVDLGEILGDLGLPQAAATEAASPTGAPSAAAPEAPQRTPVRRLEREYLRQVLADHGGNITATAEALRMHRRTLQRKLARYGRNG